MSRGEWIAVAVVAALFLAMLLSHSEAADVINKPAPQRRPCPPPKPKEVLWGDLSPARRYAQIAEKLPTSNCELETQLFAAQMADACADLKLLNEHDFWRRQVKVLRGEA